MNVPCVSIIMPVYNAELTLSRMVDGIIHQTLKDWELIAIDDGSTDNSGSILDNYASEDNRIRVIHKRNEGVSAARQTGLDAACGEYIIHADADDYIEPLMLESLYKKAIETDSDIVFCDFYIENKLGVKYYCKQQPPELAYQVIKDFFKYLHGSCTNKLAKASCIRAQNTKFIKGINYCEDLLFWIQFFLNPTIKISYVPKAFYYYISYSDNASICNTYNRALFETEIKVLNQLLNLIGDKFPQEIDMYKLSIKTGAFENPIFTPNEYYAIFPEVNNKIIHKRGSFINNFLMYISYKGFYQIGTSLYKFKNKISRNIRQWI